MSTRNDTGVPCAGKSIAFAAGHGMADHIEQNRCLNDLEAAQKARELRSYPSTLAVQINGPCNQHCIYCVRPTAYRYFDLDRFRESFESNLMPALHHAQRLELGGFGEFLLLPRARDIITYFQQFPAVEKVLYTNGTALTPKMIDCLVNSGSCFTVSILMPGCTPHFHRLMSDVEFGYAVVERNLRYLRDAIRNAAGRLRLQFRSIMTTVNVDHLSDIISYAHSFGAFSVYIDYLAVSEHRHKNISCFFEQERANYSLERARVLAAQYAIDVALPPGFSPAGACLPSGRITQVHEKVRRFLQRFRFVGKGGPGSGEQTQPDPCGHPWKRCLIDGNGYAGICNDITFSGMTLRDHSFNDIWNSQYFVHLREDAARGTLSCAKWCRRVSPAAVNDLRGHVCARGKTSSEMQSLLFSPGSPASRGAR